MTGLDIINESLLLLGVIYPGQTISPEAQATSQLGFNMMLGEWSAQGLAVFSVARETLGLIQGQGDYTIGANQMFNVARPEKIDAWSVHSSGSGAEGGRPCDAATFSAGRAQMEAQALALGLLSGPALIGQRVKFLNYDSGYPIGNIHLYPFPTFGMTLDIWVWNQFTLITDFTLPVDFPPGYLKTLVYNLAIDLAPKFGRPLDPAVKLVADECKAGLGSTNADEHSAPQVAK